MRPGGGAVHGVVQRDEDGGVIHVVARRLEDDTAMLRQLSDDALPAVTSRIKVWATLHAILFNPVVAAKMIATLDRISGGRAGLNIVAGAYRGEFAQMGAWDDSLTHNTRYDLAEEWTEVIKRLWREPRALLTPHVAVVGPYIPQRRLAVLCENARRFTAGQPLVNVVDKALWY